MSPGGVFAITKPINGKSEGVARRRRQKRRHDV
jgi:hypothetical protein